MLPADPREATYAPADAGDVARLIAAAPMAWLVSADPFAATPLPVLAVTGADGGVVRLDGHFSRRNPHVALLRERPLARFLFMGPNGYVSPSWMADRSQAPSWNYASLQITARVRLIDDAAGVGASLDALIAANEAGRRGAWSAAEMGPRLAGLARGVVAFEADVEAIRPMFKLSQDDRDDVYADILRGLDGEGAGDLATWVRRSNPGREG
ncbi:FMN-binding negative transcriptional regulator [Caulobacter sp. KR2-114]|uniref:FMN-binding negative transcriptional regulator n=1 Tax=Caulobacter sp. KR2-114 TaxID=3400912 RepID=UPI003C07C3BD